MRVHGVLNPTNISATGNFSITTKSSSNYTIDTKADCTGITYGAAFVKGSLNVSNINAYPSNDSVIAEYEIAFTPIVRIPAGSKITFTFPSANYGTLAVSAICRVSGGMESFTSCHAGGAQFWIITDEEYTPASGRIHWFIQGVKNFAQGTSSDFTVVIEFDGVTIDES